MIAIHRITWARLLKTLTASYGYSLLTSDPKKLILKPMLLSNIFILFEQANVVYNKHIY